jgi:hypothetical protein
VEIEFRFGSVKLACAKMWFLDYNDQTKRRIRNFAKHVRFGEYGKEMISAANN